MEDKGHGGYLVKVENPVPKDQEKSIGKYADYSFIV
jgi:hypothetical protein